MARLMWAALLGAGIVAEARSLRRHDGATLSETTRWVFRTHTRAGRYAFATGWGALGGWFFVHILRDLAEVVDAAHEWEETP